MTSRVVETDGDLIMEDKKTVDEGLYSRQLYVMGHEAQEKLQGSNVLIVGLRGLGVEIAKNVILAGVKSVGLMDGGITELDDLGAQFYLTPEDVGRRSRAEASLGRLVELNKYVQVSVIGGDLTPALLRHFQVVVVTETSVTEQLRINDLCREAGAKFISGDTRGVLASLFVDLGPEFTVSDATGERELRGLICSVTKSKPGERGVVTMPEGERHGLEDGALVRFEEVEGMVELNQSAPRPIKGLTPYSFQIEDTSSYHEFTGTKGYFNEVKQPKKFAFQSLRESLRNPLIINDYFGEYRVHHCIYNAISQFQETTGRLPSPISQEEAKSVLAKAAEFAQSLEITKKEGNETVKVEVKVNVEDEALLHLCRASGARICPMTAFLGGIMGQEVLKACTGKFSPIRQFFYFDARQVLPDPSTPWSEYAPLGSRYDSQIAVVGRATHDVLASNRYFLVGAGAIGCEMLKNWALMGVATEQKGQIQVTDMDIIETSNLNRQFLFRNTDVKKLKSEVAAREAQVMNPALRIAYRSLRVCQSTEDTYDDVFWEHLDGVCTALDNVEARNYVDMRCIQFHKPMIDSGTLGTKGNVQVVIPDLTESYGSSRDPPEESIPICTLKNFPNKIEHTIQWARDWFEGAFTQGPQDVNSYLSQPHFLEDLAKQGNAELPTLEVIEKFLVTEKPIHFNDCIRWARLRFQDEFHNNILQLLTIFPPDSADKNGSPFWSGHKRPPKPITFNAQDPLHLDFVIAGANLRGKAFGLKGHTDRAIFEAELASMNVPTFQPSITKKIAANDEELKKMAEDVEDDHDVKVRTMVQKLPSAGSLAGFRLTPEVFEKDDDSNFHMAFITACSNLRARNYAIAEENLHATKFIAGKIIPAIATTTALVTGLVCLEMYKVAQKKPFGSYRNSFVNLALCDFNFAEPQPPVYTTTKLKTGDWKWSLWDQLIIDIGDCTLQELLDHFQEKFGYELNMLSYGPAMLYYQFSPNKKQVKERLKKPVSLVCAEVSKTELPAKDKYLLLEACVEDDDGNEIDFPQLKFKFRA